MWKVLLIVWGIYAFALTVALIRRAPRRKSAKPISRGWGNRLQVLIIGATGGTGRQLVQQALEQGHTVTAFVRKPTKFKIEHPNLRVVQGNVFDYASVESAMEGQSAVLSALGHKRWFYPTKILSEGTRNVLRAMKAGHVPRFIGVSSLGVGSAVGRLGLISTFVFVPMILPFYFWDRLRQEKLIEESEADWVIVRPGILTNRAATGSYRHGRNVGNFIIGKKVSRADVAAFMLRQLTDDTYVGAAPGICA